ncbi:hypothetical protein FQN57_002597 [Myotisia sp. PD_48]|nr:hypothetical protein FQN57_002597 [Myotisia sp. PD_48]
MAATPGMKSVIVSFPNGTPDSVVQKAKDEIRNNGGKVTVEYTLIPGFAADAPEELLNRVKTLDSSHPATVEDDTIVSVNQ